MDELKKEMQSRNYANGLLIGTLGMLVAQSALPSMSR